NRLLGSNRGARRLHGKRGSLQKVHGCSETDSRHHEHGNQFWSHATLRWIAVPGGQQGEYVLRCVTDHTGPKCACAPREVSQPDSDWYDGERVLNVEMRQGKEHRAGGNGGGWRPSLQQTSLDIAAEK